MGNIWRPKATIKNETDEGSVLTGSWSAYPMAGYTGTIIRTNETSSYAAIEYYLDVPFSAYFDLYGYFTPNTPWTEQANYVIYSDTDSTNKTINQSDLTKKGWQKIGTVYLSEGNKRVLKIDNRQLEADKWLVADAMMIMINRKLSPEVIVTDIKEENPNTIIQPTEFRVEQNYPNPFNPVTKIRFVIPSGAKNLVTLKVYDVLGKEVATLVNEEKPAGSYEVEFNGQNLSSGVYFYKLTTGNLSQTKKMILIR